MCCWTWTAPSTKAARSCRALTVRFTTNTDSVTPDALADRLVRRGFEVAEDELVTQSRSRLGYWARRRRRGCWSWPPTGIRRLLAGHLDEPITHVLVADPSYGATYDDLDADIGGGRAVGAATVLVRSGKGARQPSAEDGPDAVVDSIADLPDLLRGAESIYLERLP